MTEKNIDFFIRLQELGDRVRIAKAVDGSEVLGRHLYLEDGSWLHRISTGVREDVDVDASRIIHSHMVRRAGERGFRVYNLGRTSGDFRKIREPYRYGAEVRPVTCWRKPLSRLKDAVYRTGLRL